MLLSASAAENEAFDFLLLTLQQKDPNSDVAIVRSAFDFAKSLHEGQKRTSGEPYIMHPLAVAQIIAELGLDTVTVATGILHDTVEDTKTTLEELEAKFGKEVASLVDGLTKISKITFQTTEEKQAENFRKMILAMAKDIRVILVKISDRLHNMRTLSALRPDKQARIAQETLDIYSPLANRLGLSQIKRELEDLSLRYLKPEIYFKIREQIAKKLKEREDYTEKVSAILSHTLQKHGIQRADVSGRSKHFYSIHKKMEKRNLSFDQIFDLTGFRILVDTVEQCYSCLGIIHSIFTPVPQRFKDYIALPKANFYQSLHTTVMGPEGERIEIQIRTYEMHEIAEKGIAAHWAYKERSALADKDKKKFEWLNRLVEWNKEVKDPTEFLETVKLDLFAEEVYVFTPKGKILEFPLHSTPLDFAYAIHSELGHQCMGAKVNNQMVPLKYRLKSGDIVEVITSPHQKPSRDWLKIVHTSRAKNRIRQYLKIEEHEKSLKLGEAILEKELKKYDLSLKNLMKSDTLDKLAEQFSLRNKEALLSHLGYGKISLRKIITRLLPQKTLEESASPTFLQRIFKEAAKKKEKAQVKVTGLDDLLVRYARCCTPVPGDPIIGFITRGRGISVHSKKCPKIFSSDPVRLVDLDWDLTKKAQREIKIKVLGKDRPGLLADASSAIRRENFNIVSASVTTTKDHKAVCHFTVAVENIQDLTKVISRLEAIEGVTSVVRVQRTDG